MFVYSVRIHNYRLVVASQCFGYGGMHGGRRGIGRMCGYMCAINKILGKDKRILIAAKHSFYVEVCFYDPNLQAISKIIYVFGEICPD